MARFDNLDPTRYQTAILIRPFRGYTETEHAETFQKLYDYASHGKDTKLTHKDMWRFLIKVKYIPLLPYLNYDRINDLEKKLEDALKEEEELISSNPFLTVEAEFTNLKPRFEQFKKDDGDVTLCFDLKAKTLQSSGKEDEIDLLIKISRDHYFKLYDQAIHLVLSDDILPKNCHIVLYLTLYGEIEDNSEHEAPTLILHDYKLHLYGNE